jgi:hypothetical protein
VRLRVPHLPLLRRGVVGTVQPPAGALHPLRLLGTAGAGPARPSRPAGRAAGTGPAGRSSGFFRDRVAGPVVVTAPAARGIVVAGWLTAILGVVAGARCAGAGRIGRACPARRVVARRAAAAVRVAASRSQRLRGWSVGDAVVRPWVIGPILVGRVRVRAFPPRG